MAVQTGWDYVHPDDTTPLAGFIRGNIKPRVDHIFCARTPQSLCEGKPRQRWNGVDNNGGYNFGGSRPRAAGGKHAPAALFAPSSLAGT